MIRLIKGKCNTYLSDTSQISHKNLGKRTPFECNLQSSNKIIKIEENIKKNHVE